MQNIPVNSRVMVLSIARGWRRTTDDAYWTGRVDVAFPKKGRYLVQFGNGAHKWFTPDKLRVIEF